MKKDNNVTILGCRGSIAASGKEYEHFGGATTCFAIRLNDNILVVDAGTGITKLSSCLAGEKDIPVLFTHAHLDHIMGFPMCPLALDSTYNFKFYSAYSDIMDYIMTPPIWPVTAAQLPAGTESFTVSHSFDIGEIHIDALEGVHTNGVFIYRISSGNKSVVVMTDCTITEEKYTEFQSFAKDCDLLLIDGQYSEEEWQGREDFGHNSYVYAAEFAQKCGAKKVRIVHHDPSKSDAKLFAAEQEIKSVYPYCSFAFEGEQIEI